MGSSGRSVLNNLSLFDFKPKKYNLSSKGSAFYSNFKVIRYYNEDKYQFHEDSKIYQ